MDHLAHGTYYGAPWSLWEPGAGPNGIAACRAFGKTKKAVLEIFTSFWPPNGH